MSKQIVRSAPPRMRRAAGFTLMELLTVVTMASILVAIASPAFNDTVRSNRLDAAATELRSAILLARSEAVKRSALVALDPVVAGDWTSGVRITVDGDRDPSTASAATDILVRQYASLKNATATGGPTRFAFDANGMNVTLASDPALRVPLDSKLQINFDSTPRCLRVNKAGMPTVTAGVC